MAADINTQLQNITTDVTAISNLVNRLVTIFSSGGVQNPDLAAMKAELQSWTQTNYMPLNGAVERTGSMIFSTGGVLSRDYVRMPNTSTPYISGDSISSARYWDFSFVDDNKTVLSDFLYSVSTYSNSSLNLTDAKLASLTFRVNRGNHGYGLNNSVSSFSYQSVLSDVGGLSWMLVPNIPNFDDFPIGVINVTTLNNLGNSVLHKNGKETVTGTKAFNGGIDIGGTNPYIVWYLEDGVKQSCFTDVRIKVNNTTELLYNKYLQYTNKGAYLFYEFHNTSVSGVAKQTGYALHAGDDDSFYHTWYGPENGTGNYVNGLVVNYSDMSVDPGTAGTNKFSLGKATALWKQVFAGSGTIQTSDKRVKQDILNIPETVLRAWGKVNFKQFRFKDAVAEKGVNARVHIGCIANEDVDSVMQAFASEGLDARKYGLFCWDRWEDQYETVRVLVKPEVHEQVKIVDAQAMYNVITKEDGTEEQVLVAPEKFHMEDQVVEEAVYRDEQKLVKPAGEQYSLRYEECLSLECAYQRWQLNLIKTKLGM